MSGKIIAVTGANGGLGRALAERFIGDGESVVLLGRTLSKVEEVARALGDRAMAVQCDVASPDSIAQTHPRIDVLINNAAVFRPYVVEDASEADIVESVMTNLAGPMLTARAAIPMLNRGGHIINLSSESVAVPLPHLVGYQSTKAGVEQMSTRLHQELEERGIRVTAVRAGQMAGPGQTPQVDAESGARFFQAAMKRGINPMERPISHFASVTHIFRALIDTPADVHVGLIVLEARRPDPA
jgi:meso-butanediol dehydrogenase / (S,S)-butanediol dehydrogenase / diacetyl reductase